MTVPPTQHLAAYYAPCMSAAPDLLVEFPPGNYVSPHMRRIRPDSCFPFIVMLLEINNIIWQHFRRDISHNFYSDHRSLLIGFLSRDESHILYNTALACPRQRTMIYQTVQIMGVAWHAVSRPVAHTPDPRIAWPLPPRLTSYQICTGLALA